MRNDKNKLIVNLTLEFALRIIEFSDLLELKRKYIIAKQLLKSGTSIGANVREAQNAENKANFIHKMSNSYPYETDLSEKLESIIKVISKIISTSKTKYYCQIIKLSNYQIMLS